MPLNSASGDWSRYGLVLEDVLVSMGDDASAWTEDSEPLEEASKMALHHDEILIRFRMFRQVQPPQYCGKAHKRLRVAADEHLKVIRNLAE